MNVQFAHFNRYLWSEPNLTVVTGESKVLEDQWLAYHLRHGIALPGDIALAQVPGLLAGAALVLTASTTQDSWGWTLTLENAPVGFFVGAEPEGMICASARPAKLGNAAMAVQRQAGGGVLRQSNYTPIGPDPLAAISGYFTHSEQVATRLACDDHGRAALVQTLPGGTLEPVASLSETELVDLVYRRVSDGTVTLMHEMLLFYECRCTEERILDMLLSLPAEHRAEVWGDQKSLEIECPRCSRVYRVNRG
jgi:hypothetical protein